MSGLTHGTHLASVPDAFVWLLVDASVVACAIFLLALLAALLLRRSSAAGRHLVWGAALLAMLLFPVLAGTIPKYRVLPHGLGIAAAREAGEIASNSTIPSAAGRAALTAPAPDMRPISTRPATASASVGPETANPSLKASAPIRTPQFASSASLLFVAWSIGAGYVLLRLALGRLWLSGVANSAVRLQAGPIAEDVQEACHRLEIRRPVEFFLTPRRVTPMTWGLLRKRVLLPAEAADWPRPRLRRVLLHELAHLKHHDTVTHVLVEIVRALYWFHPCMWWAVRRLRVERELACDDAVLQTGVRPSDYAEDLLCILVQRPIPRAALAIVGQSELEGRLRAILSETVDRRSVTRGGLAVAASSVVLVTAAVASLLPSDAPTSPPPELPPVAWLSSEQPPGALKSPPDAPSPSLKPLSGDVNMICVDESGKPVSGAEVHLFQYTGGENGRYMQSGPYTTNAKGEATCIDPIVMSDEGNYDRFLYARVPGSLVGMGRSTNWKNIGSFNPAGKAVLHPSQSVDGTVKVPPGFDPTRVRVRVQSLAFIKPHFLPGANDVEEMFPRYDGFSGLDTALPGTFESQPDSSGRFRFADVPVNARMYVAATADGLGQGQWWNQSKRFDKPIAITLEKEVKASGTVRTPDDKPAAGMKIRLMISPKESFRKPLLGFQSSFRTQTDAAGRFLLQGLPDTQMMLYVEDPKDRWVFRPLQDIGASAPGLRTVFSCRMESGALVSGRVLDPEGKPVQGAGVSALADTGFQASLGFNRTDADGRYQLHLPAGHAELYFGGLPQGFAYPNPSTFKILEIKAGESEVKIPDFTVQRTTGRRL
jgi:beta-lactamase regulating signal transducer with metallopeptidase domain